MKEIVKSAWVGGSCMGRSGVGPRSPMYTRHCIHTFMLFQMPSHNSFHEINKS